MNGNSFNPYEEYNGQPNFIRTSSLDPNFIRNNLSLVNTPVKLLFEQDHMDMTKDWTEEENTNQRRLVKFDFARLSPTDYLVKFKPIKKSDFTNSAAIISCIFWGEKELHIVTSVDIILLLEYLIQDSFTIEEKNRVRRNLQSLKPYTISRTNKTYQRFFQLLMNLEDPRPRNIEKDIKVFKWSDLFKALSKVISKYTSNENATLKVENNLTNASPIMSTYQSSSSSNPTSNLNSGSGTSSGMSGSSGSIAGNPNGEINSSSYSNFQPIFNNAYNSQPQYQGFQTNQYMGPPYQAQGIPNQGFPGQMHQQINPMNQMNPQIRQFNPEPEPGRTNNIIPNSSQASSQMNNQYSYTSSPVQTSPALPLPHLPPPQSDPNLPSNNLQKNITNNIPNLENKDTFLPLERLKVMKRKNNQQNVNSNLQHKHKAYSNGITPEMPRPIEGNETESPTDQNEDNDNDRNDIPEPRHKDTQGDAMEVDSSDSISTTGESGDFGSAYAITSSDEQSGTRSKNSNSADGGSGDDEASSNGVSSMAASGGSPKVEPTKLRRNVPGANNSSGSNEASNEGSASGGSGSVSHGSGLFSNKRSGIDSAGTNLTSEENYDNSQPKTMDKDSLDGTTNINDFTSDQSKRIFGKAGNQIGTVQQITEHPQYYQYPENSQLHYSHPIDVKLPSLEEYFKANKTENANIDNGIKLPPIKIKRNSFPSLNVKNLTESTMSHRRSLDESQR
ncbi:hypothetical protein CLIB1444_06S03114 [[Candida] jaroonii]|uniref:Uncharacterized protein n=1 Tax=[Candida] jaroonii TaxID=467808 RepID=A0ACA9Y8X8_9ASCO|nr:hypothetical protein CLIB1444_06S03114 [[Candida] jaroonii]